MSYKIFDDAIAARKLQNVQIFKETTDCIHNGVYIAPSGKSVHLQMARMINESRCFQTEISRIDVKDIIGATTVLVEPNDCLVTAERLVRDGYNPALLNFANSIFPGGGVESGARAQEETICRRSTLTRSIFSFDRRYAAYYGYNLTPGNHYPIESPFSAIYSPEVVVFRKGNDCEYMETPFAVAIITCAALNLNGRIKNGEMPRKAVDITRNKIRTIFRIGLLYNHDSLVLGAFGCGAFKNPPKEIARLFHEVMEEDEFKNKYKLLSFSIIEDHNSNNANLNAFQEEFCF